MGRAQAHPKTSPNIPEISPLDPDRDKAADPAQPQVLVFCQKVQYSDVHSPHPSAKWPWESKGQGTLGYSSQQLTQLALSQCEGLLGPGETHSTRDPGRLEEEGHWESALR